MRKITEKKLNEMLKEERERQGMTRKELAENEHTAIIIASYIPFTMILKAEAERWRKRNDGKRKENVAGR